jgi:hypothetical protein
LDANGLFGCNTNIVAGVTLLPVLMAAGLLCIAVHVTQLNLQNKKMMSISINHVPVWFVKWILTKKVKGFEQ